VGKQSMVCLNFKKLIAIYLGLCCFCLSTSVIADTNPAESISDKHNPWLERDRFKVALGTFITDYDSDILISSSSGFGTNLSFEDDLGLEDSQTVFRFAGHYRFKARHRIVFSYVDLSRDGKVITQFPIFINDTIYPTGSKLKTEFDYKVLKLAYAYSFWQTDKIDLSATVGAYTFDVDLNIISEDGVEEGESGTAPFPMFVLNLNYHINDKVRIIAGYEYFALDTNDFEGELIDVIFALEYNPFEKVGLGIGYNDVSISAEDSNDKDEFEYDYDGILAYFTINF
jgi:hypothetical protein